MKKQLLIIGVCLLFLTLCFSGWEILETKSDYIKVVCIAKIVDNFIDKNNNVIQETPVDLLFSVEFIKAGGECSIYQKKIDAAGVV